jgi:hypothetical protein
VARRAVVDRPAITLVRHADGRSNFLDLLRRREGEGAGRVRVGAVIVDVGKIALDDRAARITLRAEQVDGRLVRGEPSTLHLYKVQLLSPLLPSPVGLSRVDVVVPPRPSLERLPRLRLEGGRVRLLPHLELSGIGGTVAPERVARGGPRVRIDLEGSYGGAEAKLWSAKGFVDPLERTGAMRIEAARFSLGRIATILRNTPVILPPRTMVDGALQLNLADGILLFGGQLAVKDLSVFHPGLARTPVLELSGEAKLAGELDVRQEKLTVRQLALRSHDVELELSGTAERLSGKPLIAARVRVPPVPCQAVLDAIPPSLVPQLQGFTLKGTFSIALRTRVDYTDLEHVELGGSVGIHRCKVIKATETADAERLREPFEHQVEPSPGQPLAFTVGPENEDFVPYADISQHMINAVLTTEDAGFFKHRGFIPSQFRTALARNLQRGGFRLGASTISMQTVKNVLLGREKTLSRKLQELFLTWYLEQHLTKERMMEIYLNVIEFGPSIYGVGAAARHYFGKAAKDLSPLEAAFFASLLPSPKRRYVQYCKGELSPAWDKYVRRLLKRMAEKSYVDAKAMEEAATQTLTFARDKDALSEADCSKQLKELLESWEVEETRRLREAVQQAAPHQLELYLK